MQINSKYWDNFYQNNTDVLVPAQFLMQQQQQINSRFTEVQESIFDKSLLDSTLYRSGGKFKSPYHATLWKKRKNGQEACPVFDISLQSMLQKEKTKAYLKKLKEPTKKNKIKQFKTDLMDLHEAYKDFYQNYLKDAFFHQDKEFKLDQKNEEVIWKLLAYFTRQHDSPLNLKKGICLYGDIGTGKSTIMKMFSKFTKDHDLPTQFNFVYMDDVYTDCDSSGLESLSAYRFKSCCFDDIGMRAENNVNNYGTKINAYRELVRRQYIRYTRPVPSLSHYTTNISYNSKDHTSDLMKVFGGRELDRFREMCNFISLTGKSRRN
jgi:hypothetical protein